METIIPTAQCTHCGEGLEQLDSVSHWASEEHGMYCPADRQLYHSAEPLN